MQTLILKHVFSANHATIYVDNAVDIEGWKILIDQGDLRSRDRYLCGNWMGEQNNIRGSVEREYSAKMEDTKRAFWSSADRLKVACRIKAMECILDIYP
jgi:hypothetical protein